MLLMLMEENRIELRIEQSRPQCMMAATTTATSSREPSSSLDSESFSQKLWGEVKPLCSIYPLPPCGSLFSLPGSPLVIGGRLPLVLLLLLLLLFDSSSSLDPARAVAVFKLQVSQRSQFVYPS